MTSINSDHLPNYTINSNCIDNMANRPIEVYPGTYAPCRSMDVDPSGHLIPSWLVLIIGIGAGIILLYSEYKAHDCVPGKVCTHSVPSPDPDDDYDVYIDKLRDMVRNNYDYVAWRQALLAGILAALIVVFYLRGRLATLLELFVVAIIVFLFVYMSYAWVWAHFFHPNGQVIENQLQILRDRLVRDNSGRVKETLGKRTIDNKSYSTDDLIENSDNMEYSKYTNLNDISTRYSGRFS